MSLIISVREGGGCCHTALFLAAIHPDAVSHAFTFSSEADLGQLWPMPFGAVIQPDGAKHPVQQ